MTVRTGLAILYAIAGLGIVIMRKLEPWNHFYAPYAIGVCAIITVFLLSLPS